MKQYGDILRLKKYTLKVLPQSWLTSTKEWPIKALQRDTYIPIGQWVAYLWAIEFQKTFSCLPAIPVNWNYMHGRGAADISSDFHGSQIHSPFTLKDVQYLIRKPWFTTSWFLQVKSQVALVSFQSQTTPNFFLVVF